MSSERNAAFLAVAQELGLLTPQQAEECKSAYETIVATGAKVTLAKVVQDKGYVSAEGLRRIIAELRKRGIHPKIGPYDILARLGTGGSAAVYKAVDPRNKRVVALKVLLPALAADARSVQRFTRSAELAAAVQHVNVARVYETGRDGQQCYVAMEFVQGRELADMVSEGKPLPERDALRIIAQVAEALVACHDKGIIHRDVKPGNVIVTAGGTAKLLDLGLARETASSHADLTITGHILGTPYYMSPEQCAAARDVDARSDIYSLGATLYYLLTGRPPFVGETIYEIMKQQSSTQLPDPRKFNPAISAATHALIWKTMAKDRKARPQSAREVIQALALNDASQSDQGAYDLASAVEAAEGIEIGSGDMASEMQKFMAQMDAQAPSENLSRAILRRVKLVDERLAALRGFTMLWEEYAGYVQRAKQRAAFTPGDEQSFQSVQNEIAKRYAAVLPLLAQKERGGIVIRNCKDRVALGAIINSASTLAALDGAVKAGAKLLTDFRDFLLHVRRRVISQNFFRYAAAKYVGTPLGKSVAAGLGFCCLFGLGFLLVAGPIRGCREEQAARRQAAEKGAASSAAQGVTTTTLEPLPREPVPEISARGIHVWVPPDPFRKVLASGWTIEEFLRVDGIPNAANNFVFSRWGTWAALSVIYDAQQLSQFIGIFDVRTGAAYLLAELDPREGPSVGEMGVDGGGNVFAVLGCQGKPDRLVRISREGRVEDIGASIPNSTAKDHLFTLEPDFVALDGACIMSEGINGGDGEKSWRRTSQGTWEPFQIQEQWLVDDMAIGEAGDIFYSAGEGVKHVGSGKVTNLFTGSDSLNALQVNRRGDLLLTCTPEGNRSGEELRLIRDGRVLGVIPTFHSGGGSAGLLDDEGNVFYGTQNTGQIFLRDVLSGATKTIVGPNETGDSIALDAPTDGQALCRGGSLYLSGSFKSGNTYYRTSVFRIAPPGASGVASSAPGEVVSPSGVRVVVPADPFRKTLVSGWMAEEVLRIEIKGRLLSPPTMNRKGTYGAFVINDVPSGPMGQPANSEVLVFDPKTGQTWFVGKLTDDQRVGGYAVDDDGNIYASIARYEFDGAKNLQIKSLGAARFGRDGARVDPLANCSLNSQDMRIASMSMNPSMVASNGAMFFLVPPDMRKLMPDGQSKVFRGLTPYAPGGIDDSGAILFFDQQRNLRRAGDTGAEVIVPYREGNIRGEMFAPNLLLNARGDCAVGFQSEGKSAFVLLYRRGQPIASIEVPSLFDYALDSQGRVIYLDSAGGVSRWEGEGIPATKLLSRPEDFPRDDKVKIYPFFTGSCTDAEGNVYLQTERPPDDKGFQSIIRLRPPAVAGATTPPAQGGEDIAIPAVPPKMTLNSGWTVEEIVQFRGNILWCQEPVVNRQGSAIIFSITHVGETPEVPSNVGLFGNEYCVVDLTTRTVKRFAASAHGLGLDSAGNGYAYAFTKGVREGRSVNVSAGEFVKILPDGQKQDLMPAQHDEFAQALPEFSPSGINSAGDLVLEIFGKGIYLRTADGTVRKLPDTIVGARPTLTDNGDVYCRVSGGIGKLRNERFDRLMLTGGMPFANSRGDIVSYVNQEYIELYRDDIQVWKSGPLEDGDHFSRLSLGENGDLILRHLQSGIWRRDANGKVEKIIPGQGVLFDEKPFWPVDCSEKCIDEAGNVYVRVQYRLPGDNNPMHCDGGAILRLRPPVGPRPTVVRSTTGNGLFGVFYFFERDLSAIPAPAGREPAFQALFPVIDFPRTDGEFTSAQGVRTGMQRRFLAVFDGFLKVPAAGEYEFIVWSDDGFRLSLSGSPVSECNALHAFDATRAKVRLQRSLIPIELQYFDNEPSHGLRLEWRRPGKTNLEVIPATSLYPSREAAEGK